MIPAMNSCDMILGNELFLEKKDLKNTDKSCINTNRDDFNHGKNKSPSQKTSSEKIDSRHYPLCYEDAMKDMRLCEICATHMHEECIQLAKEVRDLFSCLKFVQ